ncbi:MAG: ABC transporter permease [Candidatus Limnocylindria bacterium]
MTPGQPLIRWDWIASNADEIALRVGEHVLLTGIAVGAGFAIAFAVSLLVLRVPALEQPATFVTGTLYTIPSLALFALLVPYTGLTIVTAEIGLIGYTLLILIRNIVGGIRSVPGDISESALGMGYTPLQVLWRIELPVALPVIVAGIRIATITTIGLVTVTALIGQGGLGFLILIGIQRFFSTPLIVGATLSIALAVAVDAALVLAQRALTPWSRAVAATAGAKTA